jgi:3-oxoacyl-[acyl-carrier protein] reductase
LENQVAMVSGSSSGIGAAIAVALAQRGADVILHARGNSERLEAVQQRIKSLGRKSFCVFADFANLSDAPIVSNASAPSATPPSISGWEDFVAEAWGWKNRIDIWVNNAGGDVLTGVASEKSFAEKLDYLWRVDVAATLHLSRCAGARMVQQFENSPSYTSTSSPTSSSNPASDSPATGQFSIVNIGWDQAATGMAGDSGEMFATTKGAIMAMTRSLAKSLAPAVRVNCVAPGWIQTAWGEQTSDYWSSRAQAESLMNRWGTPTDVAAAVAFLSSPEASFISGQIIPVNGGLGNT